MSRSRNYQLDKDLNQKLRTKKLNDSQDVKDFFFSMSPNIITPNFIKSGSRRNYSYIYEVTGGTDFQNKTIFGLTVYLWDGSEYVSHDSSGIKYTMKEVDETLRDLE